MSGIRGYLDKAEKTIKSNDKKNIKRVDCGHEVDFNSYGCCLMKSGAYFGLGVAVSVTLCPKCFLETVGSKKEQDEVKIRVKKHRR